MGFQLRTYCSPAAAALGWEGAVQCIPVVLPTTRELYPFGLNRDRRFYFR